MKVRIDSYWGSYDICKPHEKQWQLMMRVNDDKWISDLFDEEQYFDSVGDVLDLLEARCKWYLYTSKRDQQLVKIADYRKILPLLEIAYAEQLSAEYQRQSAANWERAREYADRATAIRYELADSESDLLADGDDRELGRVE